MIGACNANKASKLRAVELVVLLIMANTFRSLKLRAVS